MYIVVDEQLPVTDEYVANFEREGISSYGLEAGEFRDWLKAASTDDLEAIDGFLLGDFKERVTYAEAIRRHSRAPIIGLSEDRSLQQTLALFTASFDDVVSKPVHVREIIARSEAIWRRMNVHTPAAHTSERLKVFLDGRDPEVDGQSLVLPRRERHILEYLARHRGRRLTKTQIFNAIYGIYAEDVEESVIEGHVSKLRKKLRQRLGYDPIEAKRYVGYTFVG